MLTVRLFFFFFLDVLALRLELSTMGNASRNALCPDYSPVSSILEMSSCKIFLFCLHRTEPAQESSRRASCAQVGLGLSTDVSSSPSSVPQALCFSPEKSDFPPSEGPATFATQDEARPCKDLHPGEVCGGSQAVLEVV